MSSGTRPSLVSTVPLNPFSQNGTTCAADLDYDRGYARIFLPNSAADDTSRFRVEVTHFHRTITGGQISTRPRRVVRRARTLSNALRGDETIEDAEIIGDSPSIGLACDVFGHKDQKGLSDSCDGSLTMFTIPQDFSGGPLNITRPAMQDLIQQLDLPTTFLPILYAFGSVPRISEAGLDCFTRILNPSDPGSFDLTYLYRFKDRDEDDSGIAQSWKDRQIGVFHRHRAATNEDLFVILQPHANSLFDGGIEFDVQTSAEAQRLLMDNAFCLHQLLISSYFSGWREYMRDIADDFARCAAEVFSQDIARDYSVNFHFLQRWRNTIDNVTPVSATLDSIKRIMHGLEDAQQECIRWNSTIPMPGFDTFLLSTLSQTDGLLQSAHALEKRIANIADLLTNTIECRNQLDTARLGRHMERLTVDTVDDSTSVKIITYLSLVYLPGSFVATLFGMNFFEFDQGIPRIAIAKNFWLYVAIFLPLTAVTFTGAWLLSEKARKRRDARERIHSVVPLVS